MSTYDRIARALIPDVDFHQNHYARTIGEIVSPGYDWLDLGAGSKMHDGYGVPSSEELASRAGFLIGIDLVVEHLRRNASLNAAVGGTGTSLPFRDASFDLVTANMVFEHLDDPLGVLVEVRRVLRPGGRLVFVTPNRLHPVFLFSSTFVPLEVQRRLAARIEGRAMEHIFPTFYRANSPGAIRGHAARAGLNVESLRVVRNLPFFRSPAPALVAECLFIRATAWGPLQVLGADLVCVLRRPPG